VPNADVVKAVHVVMQEYDKIRRVSIGQEELKKAKDYIKGKALIGLESSSAMASFVGDQALLYGEAVPIQKVLRRIEAVSASDIQRVAKTIFTDQRLNLALIGPDGQKAELKRVLKFSH